MFQYGPVRLEVDFEGGEVTTYLKHHWSSTSLTRDITSHSQLEKIFKSPRTRRVPQQERQVVCHLLVLLKSCILLVRLMEWRNRTQEMFQMRKNISMKTTTGVMTFAKITFVLKTKKMTLMIVKGNLTRDPQTVKTVRMVNMGRTVPPPRTQLVRTDTWRTSWRRTRSFNTN